jgi:hypothetical protein
MGEDIQFQVKIQISSPIFSILPHYEKPVVNVLEKLLKKLLCCVTSWCSGRLIGSPRQRSRVQDPISTINIHKGGHKFQNPTRCGVLMH